MGLATALASWRPPDQVRGRLFSVCRGRRQANPFGAAAPRARRGRSAARRGGGSRPRVGPPASTGSRQPSQGRVLFLIGGEVAEMLRQGLLRIVPKIVKASRAAEDEVAADRAARRVVSQFQHDFADELSRRILALQEGVVEEDWILPAAGHFCSA